MVVQLFLYAQKNLLCILSILAKALFRLKELRFEERL